MQAAVENQGDCKSPCKIASASDRIISAIRSWNRELRLEVDSDLSKIVGPLTTAYVDCRQELAGSGLSEQSRCRPSCQPLVGILAAINEHVTKPWRQAVVVGEQNYTALAHQWKTQNPLKDILSLKEQLKETLALFSLSENALRCPCCTSPDRSSSDN